MTAVADALGLDFRREGGAVVVSPTDGTDRAAHQHCGVSGIHQRLGRNREFKLASRVLRMELIDRDPLRAERIDDIAYVVRHVDQARHPVRGTGGS